MRKQRTRTSEGGRRGLFGQQALADTPEEGQPRKHRNQCDRSRTPAKVPSFSLVVIRAPISGCWQTTTVDMIVWARKNSDGA